MSCSPCCGLTPLPFVQMSRQMVHAARKVFEKQLPGVTIDVDEVQETRSSAFGNSSGIM